MRSLIPATYIAAFTSWVKPASLATKKTTLLLFSVAVLLAGGAFTLAPKGIATPEHRAPAIAKHGSAVSRTDAEAPQHLKQQGTNRSLAKAVAAATDPTLYQEVKLQDDNGAAYDQFGWSVAISGNTAIVANLASGAAYIFVRNGQTWSLQQK